MAGWGTLEVPCFFGGPGGRPGGLGAGLGAWGQAWGRGREKAWIGQYKEGKTPLKTIITIFFSHKSLLHKGLEDRV